MGAQIGGKGLIAFRGRVRTNTTEDYRMNLACRGPGGVPAMPSRCHSGSRSEPLYNLQGNTQLLRDEIINAQSINPSINQSNNLDYFSFYKLRNFNQLASQNVYKNPSLYIVLTVVDRPTNNSLSNR